MTLTRLACAAVLGAGLLATVAAHAQVREHKLRFSIQNTKDHPLGLGAQKFADLVDQKSGGKIKVTVYPDGRLGGDVQTMSALQGGTLDLMTVTAGLLVGISKPFGVLDFPYLFNDVKEADAIVDGPIGQKLQAQLTDKGLVGLGYWDLGFRNVTNSKLPITKLEDMKGLKLRTLQSPIFVDVFSALGANPVPLSFTELYNAMEQRVVDGQENPVAVIAFAKFNEVQKYLSLTRHAYGAQSFMISKKTWDKLNADEQKMITTAAAETRAYQRQISRELNEREIGNLKASGMQVNDVSPQEIARIRERLQPVIVKYTPQVGEGLVNEINAELAKMRGGKK
jgi:tripartite ATP-independent transporter DctP family solute receptor